MSDDQKAINWYRSRIRDKQREANRLSIQVVLGAQENDDVETLAEATATLEAEVRLLEAARKQLQLVS